MSRDNFPGIRSCLRFYLEYNNDIASADPLWHSRIMMEHFRVHCSTVAVSKGVMSFDENKIRCKGRASAHSHIKSKPVRFCICLYSIVRWGRLYLHSIADNGSGDKRGISQDAKYWTLFRALRGVHIRMKNDNLVAPDSPSSALALQMSHPITSAPLSYGPLVVTYNFSTPNGLAKVVRRMNDRETRMLGTVCLTNLDKKSWYSKGRGW